jgi:type II secretory pathway component PulK
MQHRSQNTPCGTEATRRQGAVLLVVLVVLVILALAAYQFTNSMTAEYQASRAALRSVQARALAESGVNYAAALLSDPDSLANKLNGNPYNNASMFQNQGSPDSGPGRFSLIRPSDPGDTGSSQPFYFGVVDESGKINLNALLKIDKSGNVAKQILMALPNMTDDISDAILDWLDPDEDPRPNGAESNYYASLNPPYSSKNGPLDSLEELLLVKGVTPQLLYGNDRNRNGIIDPDEDDGSDKTTQLGWSAYMTVYSRELDIDSQNNPRIYLNDQDLQGLGDSLTTALGDDLANFILAARTYGLSTSSNTGGRGRTGSNAAPKTQGRMTRTVAIGRQGGGGGGGGGGRGGRPQNINSIYDLIGSSVNIPASGGGQAQVYPSPLQGTDSLRQYLPLLLDKTTTNKPGATIQPRINVSTAPAAVLQTLTAINSSITADDIQSILAQRPSISSGTAPDPIYQTPAWLMVQANLTQAKMKALEKWITGRSLVYRVQSVGYFPNGGAAARIEAVIDTNAGQPRIVYWRDLTELGKGFDLSSLTGG